MRIVIACGGTGGHIYPGLAVAEALRERDPAAEVLFIGGSGLEASIIPQHGWPFRAVAARQLPRRAPLRVPFALAAVLRGTVQAAGLLRSFGAQVVVATGGYAAAPVGAAAALLRIPVVLQEQNLFPGLTNRVLSRVAARISIPHERVRRVFPRGTVTGVPIRRGATGGLRPRGLARFGLAPGLFTVLVLGGSQGAKSLNGAMLDALGRFGDPAAVQVLHQTGKEQAESVRARAAAVRAPRCVAVGYIDDVADAYAAADLVVCRAGAATIAEVTANGLPAVLVPYPFAAGGHQDHNAALLAAEGAAIVVPDREVSGERLAGVIDALRADGARRRAMAEASRRLGRPQAAAAVAVLAAEAARKEQA